MWVGKINIARNEYKLGEIDILSPNIPFPFRFCGGLGFLVLKEKYFLFCTIKKPRNLSWKYVCYMLKLKIPELEDMLLDGAIRSGQNVLLKWANHSKIANFVNKTCRSRKLWANGSMYLELNSNKSSHCLYVSY